MGNDNKVQGEGDYEAARRYRERTDEFVENNDIEEAALKAAPRTPQEAADLQAAEAAGKKRAKGEDPALRRPNEPAADGGASEE
jgi:hypothetical protein